MNNPENSDDQQINEQSCQEEHPTDIAENALEAVSGAGALVTKIADHYKTNAFEAIAKTQDRLLADLNTIALDHSPRSIAAKEAWLKTPASQPSQLRRSNSAHF